MKKKVLFALIALLSFVSAWAEGETIVNTNGSAGFVVLPAGGVAADDLAVKIGTETLPGTAIYASDGVTAVNGNITKVGNYFLKVENSESLYPFQAAKKFTSFEIIDNEDKYESSRADGVLSLYYPWADATPPYREDYWNTEQRRAASGLDWIQIQGDEYEMDADGFYVYEDCERNWYGALSNPIKQAQYEAGYKSGWPWVGVNFSDFDFDGNSYKVVLRYEDQETTPYEIIDKPLKDDDGNVIIFGNGTGLKAWAVEKLAQTFEKPEWSIGLGDFEEGEVQVGDEFVNGWVYQGDDDESYDENFDPTAFSVLLFPADEPQATLLRDYDWTMTPVTVGYNAQAQKPTITVTAKDIAGATVTVPEKNATDNSINWIVKYFDAAGDEVEEMIDKGEYTVKVYLPSPDEPKEIGSAKQFTITAFTLTLGASTTYKQLGDPDPEPQFGFLYDNTPEAVKTEAAKLKISGLYLHRYPEFADTQNDKVGREIHFFMEMNNASVKNQDGTPNTNYTISISSTDAWLLITQKLLREGEFKAVVNDPIFTYDGLAKEPTDIQLYQDMNYGKDGMEEDWQLVSGLESIYGTVAANFDITYRDNINADAYGEPRLDGEAPNQKEVFDYMTNVLDPATVILTPKANGNFASRISIGNEEYLEGVETIEEAFKIKQRDISTATIAEIKDVIFKNAAFMPEPAVTYANGTDAGLTLVKETDFTYDYDKNTYVGEATTIVEAVYTGGTGDNPKKYNGNWWNKKETTFTINPFVFTLKPQDITKTVGDPDPNPLTELEAIPSANMKDGDQPLALPVDDVAILLKDGWTISRAKGESVGIWDIRVNNAELKASSDPAAEADPAHNYVMTVETGVLEIIEPSDYYVSSKGVTREFRSGDTSIPFDGFYLYIRNSANQYLEVTEGEVYEALSAQITANERYGVGGNFPQVGTYNNQIRPVLPTSDDLTFAYLPVDAYTHENEGDLAITPRKITILAEDKTSVFGEDYATLTYKVYNGHVEAADATKVLDGTVDVDGDGNLDNFTVNTSNQYGPNTIARFGGLASNIATLVDQAQKPLTANVTANIVAQNQATTTGANPNYDIKFINGTYTVTPSTEGYYVDIQWNKKFGDQDWTKTVTWKFGENKESAEPVEQAPSVGINFSWTDDNEPTTPATYRSGTDFTIVTDPANSNVIGGYPVTYEGTATITKADAVIIAVKPLGSEYPVPPTLSFDNKRVTVTGGATFDEIAAFGDFDLTYVKPEVGFIKKGATVQVEFNGKPYGTAAGEEVSADDWAWAANYEKVTVKSNKVNVTAAEDITLDIVAFNKANYTGAGLDLDAEINDELIRDYAGTEVNSVTITCSEQEYKVKADQWYTMVLPFTATVREIQTLFNGFVGVDQLKKENSASKASEIRFGYTTKDIPANNPFLAKTDKEFTFVEKTIDRDGEKIMIEYPEKQDGTAGEIAIEDANHNKVIGTYNAFVADNTNDYVYIQLSDGEFHPMNVGTYVRPLGAYIKVADDVPNNEAPVRIIIEEADGTETVINAVDADAEVAYGEGWYTITGIKLDAEPTTSGTYIFNGKKVFIQK